MAKMRCFMHRMFARASANGRDARRDRADAPRRAPVATRRARRARGPTRDRRARRSSAHARVEPPTRADVAMRANARGGVERRRMLTRTALACAIVASTARGVASVDCSAPIVTLKTGTNSACAGSSAQTHEWPLYANTSVCHGWQDVDNAGATHDNSAKNMRCNGDGTFSFDQYAGNLVCNGSPVTKTYASGRCDQDVPPTLYTIGHDLTCCVSGLSAAGCATRAPTARNGAALITMDGATCTNSSSPSPPASSSTGAVSLAVSLAVAAALTLAA